MIVADAATLPYEVPPEIHTPAGEIQSWPARWTYKNPSNADASTNEKAGFAAHISKLRALRTNQALWPDKSDPPSSFAIQWAQLSLQQLEKEGALPTRVVASAEGGVAICFIQEDMYADIECLNSGEILGVISDRRSRPTVWEVEQNPGGLASAAAAIQEFIQLSEALANDSGGSSRG